MPCGSGSELKACSQSSQNKRLIEGGRLCSPKKETSDVGDAKNLLYGKLARLDLGQWAEGKEAVPLNKLLIARPHGVALTTDACGLQHP